MTKVLVAPSAERSEVTTLVLTTSVNCLITDLVLKFIMHVMLYTKHKLGS